MTADVGVWRGIVLMSMRRDPEGFNEIGVSSMVISCPPVDNVVSATENLVGFAVKVWPSTVKIR